MSILFRRPESRAVSLQSWWGSGDESPLRASSAEVALSIVAVYAATGLIADQIAATPWAVFDETGGLPSKAKVQPDLVRSPGVNGLDLFSWKHQMVTSILLWGNAFGYIADVDLSGIPSRVAWLRPDHMRVDESGHSPRYWYKGVEIDRSLIIHIPWYVLPGSVVGLSPIALYRSQIETGIEAQKVSRNFFRRGMVPSGFLKNTDKTLTAEEARETKKRFNASVSATEPFVAGADWDYKAIGLPASDVAFLAGLKGNATQVAAIYRVSPEDVGGETSSSSLTYKNLEQDQIRFNVRTLRPVAARIESVTDRYLPDVQYVRFNLDASVRADLKTRFEAHEIAARNGFETLDEIRALEERPPLTVDELAEFKDLRNTTTIGNQL